ncbi:hypothetical protein [Streptomyces jumonjinensis]|uniref:Restriction endonuclease n=1 Tax=Streptomyces jumonjinensis TaxID=1945 RepID=A0A646KED7_STRJU|nr:hypothetical protein [Streptomyces jumonjinensis]MQT00357.1 hypothetical protein [Streptomyces jumonjinensis]
MAIDWDRIGQPAFDRHVEALLYRVFAHHGEVTPVNGRGGDGGIDVGVTTEAGLRIFQLKYYPDGFPGSMKGRRASIKKSFNRAMQHGPVEWTLVVPCTLSPSDRAYVNRLRGQHSVRITAMDRAELDSRFAQYPDLEASFTRDQLREAARDFNQEKALLFDPEDLAQRIFALGIRADNVDPDWTWDFERQGRMVKRTLRAKHPQAHTVSPVSLTLTGRPEVMSPSLKAALTRSLGFGTAEEVVLPPETVESLTVNGPAWLAKTVVDAEVIWRPAPRPPASGESMELAFLGAHGSVAARYAGTVNSTGSGGLGISIDAEIHGARLQFMLPFSEGAVPALSYSFELAGRSPSEAARILSLHQRLMRGGDFDLMLNGMSVGSGTLAGCGSDDDLEETQNLLLYLSDLDVIQRHCENYFPAPFTFSGTERIMVRLARLIIEGRCMVHPLLTTITATLNGTMDPAIETVLGGEPQCLRFTPPNFEITIGNRTLDIGTVHFLHHRIVATNGADALSTLRSGQGAGTKVLLCPTDGEHYRVFLDGAPDDGLPLIPAPLELPGFPEPR